MSFDEIFDLTAGVYFNFYNIVFHVRIHPKLYTFFTTPLCRCYLRNKIK